MCLTGPNKREDDKRLIGGVQDVKRALAFHGEKLVVDILSQVQQEHPSSEEDRALKLLLDE